MKKAKGRADASLCLIMYKQLLGFGGGLGLLGLLALVPVVLFLELLDAARGVNELHLAGEERMAHRTDFGVDVLLGAARGKLVAAAARDGRFFVFGVDVFFHGIARFGKRLLLEIITMMRKTSRGPSRLRRSRCVCYAATGYCP